jgi:chorismate mutase
LPLYKMPRRFEFRESLPRAPGGKVLRSILESSEMSPEPIEPVSDVQEELVRIDRKILSLLNRRTQLLGQETDPKSPGLIPEDYLQRVLDTNEGPLYDDIAEDLLKQIHSATKFPRGK